MRFELTTLSLEGRSVVCPGSPNASQPVGISQVTTPRPVQRSRGFTQNRRSYGPYEPQESRRPLDVLRGGGDNLLTVREVAARLVVSRATVYKLVDRGELPHVRISNAIRIAPADLNAFIERARKVT